MDSASEAPKVLVICARRYNGFELWNGLKALVDRGIKFELTSVSKHIEDEVTAEPRRVLRTYHEVTDAEVSEFAGLMVISGNRIDTQAHYDDKQVQHLVDEFNAAGKPIAAICVSVPTIRRAARAKRVAFYPLIRSRQLLTYAGAILSTKSVEVDRNLVTAEHQMATKLWGSSFAKLIMGEEASPGIVDSHYVPAPRLKRPDPEIQRLRDSKIRPVQVES
jgi:putative intracellular protease/amidase